MEETTGEVITHGGWNREASAMSAALEELGAALEQMLASLNAKEAGRDQVNGVVAWADMVGACRTQGEELLADTNARLDPVVDAVAGAGGVDQVARADYYAEV